MRPSAHMDILCIFRCKKLSAARKQMAVYRAPNVLVIQLKVRYMRVAGSLLSLYGALLIEQSSFWCLQFCFEGLRLR